MTSTTTSRIVWPRPALAGCVFSTIIRDTRGVALGHFERFNFFPASPLCSVTWLFAGDWHVIDQRHQMERPWTGARVPSLAFFGTQLWPRVSWNPGETFAITLSFYPDAFSAMTALDLGPFTGCVLPAEEILPQRVLEVFCDFLKTVPRDGVERGLTALDNEIEAMWTVARPAQTSPINSVKDWSRNLAWRAAVKGPGSSSRQIARRFKSWTGINQRGVRALGHSEQLFAALYEASRKGDVNWAGLATSSGFADQAHMIRQMRQSTGFTPTQLRQRARTDEAFWGYRLLAEYFALPKD